MAEAAVSILETELGQKPAVVPGLCLGTGWAPALAAAGGWQRGWETANLCSEGR